MSFSAWSADGLLREQSTQLGEIKLLLAGVDRDLADASVAGLSADRKFTTAYEAVLGLATMRLRTQNLRASGDGSHRVTLQAIPLVLGQDERQRAKYFDACRIKRHVATYERAGGISRTEADELLLVARMFRTTVLAFLRDNFAALSPE